MKKNDILFLIMSGCILNIFGAASSDEAAELTESAACQSVPKVSMEVNLRSSLPLLAKDGIVLDDALRSEDLSSKAIYFGVGLCNKNELSAGLPFDFLGLVVTAEKIRKVCGFGKVILLIADSHALTNNFAKDTVKALADDIEAVSRKIVRNLGLENIYVIIRASSIDTTPESEYQKIFSEIPESVRLHDYEKKQLADMEYMAKKYNVRLKVGWSLSGGTSCYDEVVFDKKYQEYFKRPYSFVYNSAAVTFDIKRRNVCPYTSRCDDKRLSLKADQDAEILLPEFLKSNGTKQSKAPLERIEKIIKMVEELTGKNVPDGSLGSKVNYIICFVLR